MRIFTRIIDFTVVIAFLSGTLAAAVLETGVQVFAGDGSTYSFNVPYKTGTNNVTDSLSTPNYYGYASAAAEFGVLHAAASSRGQNYLPHTFSPASCDNDTLPCAQYSAIAYADFLDKLIITGGTGTGYLVLRAQMDGSISSTGSVYPPGVGYADLSFWASTTGSPQTFNDLLFQPDSYAGDTGLSVDSYTGYFYQPVTSNPIPFIYGQPLYFSVDLNAQNIIDDSQATGPYNFGISTNFYDTAAITGLSFYSDPDAQHPITNVTVTSESGTNYAAIVASPEPASLLMCGLGLALLLETARRRRQSRN